MAAGSAPTDESVRLRAAAARVLQDKTFSRAPVMSRLLLYLVDRTLDGGPVKSYTIATDALGRAEDDGADADTYARVAVARLRKALATYYVSHPDEDEIYIDSGSYAVRVRSRALPLSPAGTEPVQPRAGARLLAATGKRSWRFAIAGLVITLLIVAAGIYQHRQSQQRWLRSNLPTLTVLASGSDAGATTGSEDLTAFGRLLYVTLADYFGFRLVRPDGGNADYEIRLDVDQTNGTRLETVTLMEVESGRIVWTRQYPIADQAGLLRSAQLAAAAIAAPGGALNVYGRRKRLGSGTPYGCWLQFTGSVMSYSSRADSELQQCAKDWYAADEESRTAAFLRNWTMVDASMTTLGEDRRRAELEAALTVVHRALARNPENGMLYVGEMRTYSFLGMSDEVRRSARSAMEAAPDNRTIVGMAGTWLAFWNDPQGKEILAGLATDADTSLPWEHAGHLMVAMMEDDVEGAGQHLSALRFYLEDQPALNLFEAAYCRRIGQEQAAQVALDRLRSDPLAWFVGPDMVMQRLPLAPEVKARLREWLAYPGSQAIGQAGTDRVGQQVR